MSVCTHKLSRGGTEYTADVEDLNQIQLLGLN